MTYIPNPERKIKKGKAVVSAKELADFKDMFGDDKTLRDLLNTDKGLQRKLNIPKSMRRLPTDSDSNAPIRIPKSMRNLPPDERDLNIRDKAPNIMDEFKIPEKGHDDLLRKSGGAVKKMAKGGGIKSKAKEKNYTAPEAHVFRDPENIFSYREMRDARLKKVEDESREFGRTLGRERQEEADWLGGVLGTPLAYVKRAGQYVGDKFTDADAYLSEKTGMHERAAARRGQRAGLKEEGYKKGGSVSSTSSRGDGIAQRGKTRGRIC